MLFAILEFALESGFWTAKKTYALGYWMMYGTPKSETEILLERQNKILKEELDKINSRLEKIENWEVLHSSNIE